MSQHHTRIADLYRMHFRTVYAYCRRRTSPDLVDDAVSETFLVAFRREEDLPGDERVLPWLYGVAYRVLSNQWRSLRRTENLRSKLKAAGVEPMTIAEDFVVGSHENETVAHALDRLRRSDRELLRLAYWEELPHQSIAVALDIKPGAAKQRLYEARRRFEREYNRLEGKSFGIPAAQEGGGR